MASQQSKQPILQVEGLSMAYGGSKVLEGVSLHILEGEIFGLIGASGSGKTTLLELLIGFLEPTKGDVLCRAALLNPQNEGYASIAEDHDSASRLFGFATQNSSFYEHLTVKENLFYFGTLYDLPADIIRKNMGTLLQVVGMSGAQDALAGDLSSGMKKRLDIACALIHNPKILIMDEPTADLDVTARKQIWGLVKRINDTGTTIIMASHMLDEVETLCDSIAVLHNRRIVSKGAVEGLRNLYSEHEQVHLQTEKKDYAGYAAVLERQKDLKITGISLQGNKLVVSSMKSEETLHYLIHLVEKFGDKVIDLYLSRPSLNEIFESITKEK